MSKLPKPSRTFRSIVKAMEEEQRKQRSSSPFAGSGQSVIDPGQILQDGSVTIPDTGLLLVDGGDVVMLNEALVEVFELGIMQHADRGLVIRRDDDTVAVEMRKIFGPADLQQKFRILDGSGRTIAGDSILSFSGFDAPHMAMPFIPVDYTSAATAQTTSSGTFVATHEHRGFRQNPALAPVVAVKCSDGSTSAEVQFYDVTNAVYLGGPLGSPAVVTATVPIGTTTFTSFAPSPAMQLPGNMSDPLHLQIHVRRTAGAGSVSVAPVRTIGSGF